MKVNALPFIATYILMKTQTPAVLDRHETLDMTFISVSNYPVLADWLVMLWE
jgi:hypothetical protein